MSKDNIVVLSGKLTLVINFQVEISDYFSTISSLSLSGYYDPYLGFLLSGSHRSVLLTYKPIV